MNEYCKRGLFMLSLHRCRMRNRPESLDMRIVTQGRFVRRQDPYRQMLGRLVRHGQFIKLSK